MSFSSLFHALQFFSLLVCPHFDLIFSRFSHIWHHFCPFDCLLHDPNYRYDIFILSSTIHHGKMWMFSIETLSKYTLILTTANTSLNASIFHPQNLLFHTPKKAYGKVSMIVSVSTVCLLLCTHTLHSFSSLVCSLFLTHLYAFYLGICLLCQCIQHDFQFEFGSMCGVLVHFLLLASMNE